MSMYHWIIGITNETCNTGDLILSEFGQNIVQLDCRPEGLHCQVGSSPAYLSYFQRLSLYQPCGWLCLGSLHVINKEHGWSPIGIFGSLNWTRSVFVVHIKMSTFVVISVYSTTATAPAKPQTCADSFITNSKDR